MEEPSINLCTSDSHRQEHLRERFIPKLTATSTICPVPQRRKQFARHRVRSLVPQCSQLNCRVLGTIAIDPAVNTLNALVLVILRANYSLVID